MFSKNRGAFHDWKTADEFLGKRWRKNVVYKTEIYRDARCGDIVVQHYSTDIIRYCKDGTYMLNVGWMASVSTVARLNAWTPFAIYRKKGVLHINGREWDTRLEFHFDREGNVL